jgi:DNA-binding MarR family transcriptional regulator
MGSSDKLNRVLREWVEVFMRRSVRDFRHFMAETGLSPSQIGTLMRLRHCRSIGVSEIGGHIGITTPAASQLVDRLVVQGLLERAEDPNDRRYKQVSLTNKGRHLVEVGIRPRQSWMEEMTSTFTLEEQERITEVLVMLTEAARRLEAEQTI